MFRKLLLVSGAAVTIAAATLSAQSAPQAPSPSAPAPAKIGVPYTMFTLANGLTVILHEDHSVPLVAVNVWYHVGSAREKPGRTGFAHLFEHLMFEGSGTSKKASSTRCSRRPAATTTARPTNDRTNYYIDVPSNALDLALFLESDRMGYLLDDVRRSSSTASATS
jgi:zinc protease